VPLLATGSVRLVYDERPGDAGGSLVFVHGAMSNRATFRYQLDHFEGRRRVAFDLRGHGESEVTDDGYEVTNLARDLAAVCDQLGLNHGVVVGHSLGGAAALQYAADHPDRVSGLVLLDSPVLMPPDFAAGVAQLAQAARSPMYDEAINGFMGQFAGSEDRLEIRRQVLSDVARTPKEVVAACLESTAEFDGESAAAAYQKPLMYVSSGPWFTDVGRFRALCPQLVTAQSFGSGHYHQLEVPDQINAFIDRFLEVNSL